MTGQSRSSSGGAARASPSRRDPFSAAHSPRPSAAERPVERMPATVIHDCRSSTASTIVAVLRRRPQSGERRGDRLVGESRQHRNALRDDPAQHRLLAGGMRAVLLVLGGRPEQQVAEHGARQQHALGALGRHLQDDGVDEIVRRFVEDEELALARADREVRLRSAQFLDLVAEQAGGVDDELRRELACRGARAASRPDCARSRARRRRVTSVAPCISACLM